MNMGGYNNNGIAAAAAASSKFSAPADSNVVRSTMSIQIAGKFIAIVSTLFLAHSAYSTYERACRLSLYGFYLCLTHLPMLQTSRT